MNSSRCANCGLVLFATEGICRGCGQPTGGGVAQPVPYETTKLAEHPTDISRVPSYGVPPHTEPTLNPQAPSEGIWRQGAVLVFQKSAVLPDRCIKCNEPAYGVRVNRRVSWHHPALALLILVAIVAYLVVARVAQKSAQLSLGFCQYHKTQRTRWVVAGWLLFAACVAAFLAALATEEETLAVIGLVLLLATVVTALIAGSYIKVKKIDDYYVWLRGIDPEYLNQFPSL